MCSLQRGTRGLRHRFVSLLRGTRQAVYLPETRRRARGRRCANFWCAASTYSIKQKPTRTCSKKTHTHCPQASELKQWSKRPGSQTVTKKNLSHDGLRRSRSFGILCHDDRRRADIKLFKKKVPSLCTSVRAVARPQKPPQRLRR